MTDDRSPPRVPRGLSVKGTRLWREMHKTFSDFNPAELVLIEESCRIADRLDRLNSVLTGTDDFFLQSLPDSDTKFILVVDGAMSEARQQANVLKQIIAALRLPDEDTGRRPIQRNNGARGAHAGHSNGKAAAVKATVSSLDRARQARSG